MMDLERFIFVGVVREHFKVGSGRACCTETELVMEAVIMISDISRDNSTCLRESSDKTEVLYYVF